MKLYPRIAVALFLVAGSVACEDSSDGSAAEESASLAAPAAVEAALCSGASTMHVDASADDSDPTTIPTVNDGMLHHVVLPSTGVGYLTIESDADHQDWYILVDGTSEISLGAGVETSWFSTEGACAAGFSRIAKAHVHAAGTYVIEITGSPGEAVIMGASQEASEHSGDDHDHGDEHSEDDHGDEHSEDDHGDEHSEDDHGDEGDHGDEHGDEGEHGDDDHDHA